MTEVKSLGKIVFFFLLSPVSNREINLFFMRDI
jgi:hypothetical protein